VGHGRTIEHPTIDAIAAYYASQTPVAGEPSASPETAAGKKIFTPETPSFGRYAEIPYDQMTSEQQEGYRSLIETRGALGGPNKIWAHCSSALT
jgi:hypothetical protein